MNSLSVAVFCLAVAVASASIVGHGGITGLGSPAVIAGPSGSVVRGGLAAAPALVGGHGLGLVGGHGLGLVGGPGIGLVGGHGLGLGLGLGGGIIGGHGGLVVPAGHGLEGQWIPDINEHLHDDGSYKPHIYGH